MNPYHDAMERCAPDQGLRDRLEQKVLSSRPERARTYRPRRKKTAVLLLAAVLLYARRSGRAPARPLGRGPAFWAGAGLGGAFLLVGGLAALDFDRAFVVFHALFFPGKDNWLFDPQVDQIINILPQEFFRSCAILILALLALGCAALILWDILRRKHPH